MPLVPVPAEQRFERFFKASSDCQFYVRRAADGAFRYFHVNPAALSITGRSEEAELIGLTPIEALGEDYGRTVEDNINQAFRLRSPYHFNGPLGSAEDSPIYDACYYPMMDEEDNVVGVLGSARDVTDLSSLNHRLLHAQKLEALGELAGGVAHDFNNILTIMQSALRFLTRDDLAPDKRERVLSEAKKTLENGTALTRRLTAFARKEKIQAISHDVNELVSSCRPMVRRVLGKRIELDVQLDPDLWRACCDRSEFEISMMNLAANARDAIEDSGTVVITARNRIRSETDPTDYPAECVEITLSDNGSGMPEDVRKKALAPFFTTKAEGKGTGLGLSGVARFVNDIGGAMHIASVLGEGTAVSLLLPREQN